MVDEQLVKRLVAVIGGELGVSTSRPLLRVVGGTDVGLGEPGRELVIARIKDLARMYWLAWLVRQETAHAGKALEDFSADELADLMHKMERGHTCRVEGIAFDDAGLVRGSLDNLEQ